MDPSATPQDDICREVAKQPTDIRANVINEQIVEGWILHFVQNDMGFLW